MMKIKLIKYSVLSLAFFLSEGCSSSSEYTFESGKRLCVTSEVISAKKSNTLKKYQRLLIHIENMPIDVSESRISDPIVSKKISRRLILSVDDRSKKFDEEHYSKIYNQALVEGVIEDPELGLYKLFYKDSSSALKSYDVLSIKPNLENEQKDLHDWYIGSCVEGIAGRPDICQVTYPLNDFILNFSIRYDGLAKWNSVIQQVNKEFNSWHCGGN